MNITPDPEFRGFLHSLIAVEAQIKAEVRAEMPGLSEAELEEMTLEVWKKEARGE